MAARHRARVRGLPTLVASIGVGLLVGSIVAVGGSGVDPSAEAADSSAVTVSARDQDPDIGSAPLPDLRVTVSQTRDLLAQGIEISWTGGRKSEAPTSQTGGSNFLQVMQCWGTDENGGPDRTTCQYGAFNTAGAQRFSLTADEQYVAPEDQPYTAPRSGPFNPAFTSVPFRSATGVTIEAVKDGVKQDIDPSTNQFFTRYTSNEVPWAGSASNGEGSVKFALQTVAQSPGLGCGAPREAADGVVTGAPCWLVIVPRGTSDPGEQFVVKSGLDWSSWKHRIAVPLEFLPVGVRCTVGSAERQVAGSEIISEAMRSWQPALCGRDNGSAYTLIAQPEPDALLTANGAGRAPLALTTEALDPEFGDRLLYAPVALAGLSISFSIDRAVRATDDVPAEVRDLDRLPFEDMKLTPRLVAKLITYSYVDSLPVGADRTHLGYTSPTEPGPNARNLTADPEFVELNPEWANMAITSPSVGDMLVPLGRSDAARAVWDYVLSDPEAVAFLNGEPDPWGMRINPWSSTNPDVNPVGSGFEVPRDDFPRTDPVEQPAVEGGAAPVNLVTWRPYANDLDAAASLTLLGDGQILGAWDPNSDPPKYSKAPRRVAGDQAVIGLTSTPAGEKFQVYTAALRNGAGEFVTPTADSLAAAAAAMTTTDAQPQVYGYDATSSAAKGAPTAYPLAMPVYAAANPDMEDAALRTDYANFIQYAVTAGQEPGTSEGQLPPGYAPLPQGWREVALLTAQGIRDGVRPVPGAAPGSGPSGGAVAPAAATAYGSSVGTTNLPAASAGSTAPTASGAVAGPLIGKETPDDPKIGPVAAAVPAAIASGLGCAIGAPLLTRLRRRAT